MDVLALLTDFQCIGLIVELTGAGKLRIDGPAHPEAAALIAILTKHKAEVIAVLSAPAPLPPVADGYERIALNAGEEIFLIESPHDPNDWTDPDRIERWASKRQMAQTAADLAAQSIVGKQAFRMCTIAGFTSPEAGYIAKLIRTGEWRAILEEKYVAQKTDRLAALLAAA